MTQSYDLISLAKKIVIDARDEAERIASQDEAFTVERSIAFAEHCATGHNADFEVCTDPRCRAVVVEEARRGLLDPGDVWPPIEPDDNPLYMPVYVCAVTDESGALNIAGVLSDYGAAVNWLDADRDNRALLFFALNKMVGEYATSEEPAK